MLRRPMARLATAVAVTGAVCALGASAAFAAPAGAVWTRPSKPIAGTVTHDSPGAAFISFPNGPQSPGSGIAVAWRGPGTAGHIFIKYRTPKTRHFSKTTEVPGALTSSAPAIASYTDQLGRSALLVVWSGHANHHIWYSAAETQANGTISGWTKPTYLPKSPSGPKQKNLSYTYNAPAVFFLEHSTDVMVAWRAPYNHVRYSIGTPAIAGRGFNWSQSTVIPGAPDPTVSTHCTVDPCTSATPAIAEVSTSSSTGTVYVFWKQLGSKAILYSTASDPSFSGWTVPAQVPSAVTLTAPAASGFEGSVLLVYKTPFSSRVHFQTLTGGVWSAVGGVFGTLTNQAPALSGGLLATTTPTPIGNVQVRFYKG
jgi:hypothetical protein